MNKVLAIPAPASVPTGRYESDRPAVQCVTVRRGGAAHGLLSLAALRYRQESSPFAAVPPLLVSIRR